MVASIGAETSPIDRSRSSESIPRVSAPEHTKKKKAERSEKNCLELIFNNNKTFCARRRRAFFFVLRRVDAIRNDSIGLIVFGEGVQFHVRTPIVQKPDFPVWCVLTDQNLSKRTKPTKIYQHPTPPSRFGVLT